jgi:hypothetical protein
MSDPTAHNVRNDETSESLSNRTPDHPQEDRETTEPGGLYTDAENTGAAQRPSPGTEADETPPNRQDPPKDAQQGENTTRVKH